MATDFRMEHTLDWEPECPMKGRGAQCSSKEKCIHVIEEKMEELKDKGKEDEKS